MRIGGIGKCGGVKIFGWEYGRCKEEVRQGISGYGYDEREMNRGADNVDNV